MSGEDPSKRIPKSLETDAKLFGTYTLTDLAVGALPGVVVVLVLQVLIPPSLAVRGIQVQSLTLPLAAVAMSVGILVVYLTPAYVSTIEWVSMMVSFQLTPTRLAHEAAKQYTSIERVYPEDDVIERTDGSFLGMVQVTPPAMALATDEEWHSKATDFQNFLNTSVDFPIQIYSTTRPFPVEDYLAQYESRLDDQDVKANPRLEALIENYLDWYAADLERRRMTIRDHYVITSVAPSEVHFETESLTQNLSTLPVIGLFIKVWLAPGHDEVHTAMSDALDERLTTIERGIREIEGCSTRRVHADEATELIAEFWDGRTRPEQELEKVIRTTPIVSTDGGHK